MTLETMRKQVVAHRAQGLKLVETGGNPDGRLRRAKRRRPKSSRAFAKANPMRRREAKRSAGAIQEAQSTIEQVQKARTSCDRDPAARLRETERLRAAMSQAEAYQADLERDFATSSWSGVARNLEQAAGPSATFDRQVQDSVAVASSPNQEYLKGGRMLEEWPASSKSSSD